MRLPQKTIESRDAQIFDLKQQGHSFRKIAEALHISTSTAHDGYHRELKRQAKYVDGSPQNAALTLLDKLDKLESFLWPMARPHTINPTDVNGNPQYDSEGNKVEIPVPPNLDAIDRIMKIQAQRAKMFGLERDVVQIESINPLPALDAGDGEIDHSAEHLTKQLALEMIKSNVLDGRVAGMIEAAIRDEDIVDAELVEDLDEPRHLLAIEAAEDLSEENIPEWNDEENESSEGWWVPEIEPREI